MKFTLGLISTLGEYIQLFPLNLLAGLALEVVLFVRIYLCHSLVNSFILVILLLFGKFRELYLKSLIYLKRANCLYKFHLGLLSIRGVYILLFILHLLGGLALVAPLFVLIYM